MNQNQLERVLEAALFAAAEPLSIKQCEQMIDSEDRPDRDTIKAALDRLVEHYHDRGVNLVQVASGYHFVTHPDTAQSMQRLLERKPPRYSRALLETLALIIYRQPITRGEIEQVRGVAVNTKIIQTLLDREWVHVVGHKAVPGQPALYATTKQLLDYFNVRSLEELPPLADLVDLDDVGDKLSKQLALDIPDQDEQEVAEHLLQPGEAGDEADHVDDDAFDHETQDLETEEHSNDAEDVLGDDVAKTHEENLAEASTEETVDDVEPVHLT